MSLISSFPAIHLFFKKDKFDDVELNNLITEIELKYPDKIILKQVKNLIKLELLKYLIESDDKKQERIRTRLQQEKSNTKRKKDLKKLMQLKNKSVLEVAKLLGHPLHHLDFILKHLNIVKESSDTLSEVEVLKTLNFLKDKNNKIPRKKSNNRHNLNAYSSVYDKIYQNKGIGKVIYIRK